MKGLEFMALINIANPKGGRPLGCFNNLCIDKRTGMSGYKIGYLDSDYLRGEPIVIPLREINRFNEDLGWDNRPKMGIIGSVGQKMVNYTTKHQKTRKRWFFRQQNGIEWM